MYNHGTQLQCYVIDFARSDKCILAVLQNVFFFLSCHQKSVKMIELIWYSWELKVKKSTYIQDMIKLLK